MLAKKTISPNTFIRDARLSRKSRKNSKLRKWVRIHSRALLYGFLLAYVLVSLFPFLWALVAPFNNFSRITTLSLDPFPSSGEWTTTNYNFLFNDPVTSRYLGVWMANSFVYSGGAAILNVFFNFLAGYALARIAFRGKKLYLWYMIAGMMIPAQITQVPQLIILIQMGVLGNKASNSIFFIGIIFTSMTSASWVFLVRQFYINVGASAEEAGKLDGLSTFGTFFRISLRQMVPLMATMFALIFMACWNNFVSFTLWSGFDPNRMNVVAGLSTVGSAARFFSPDFAISVTLAATNLAVLPTIVLYLFSLYFQKKQNIEGEK